MPEAVFKANINHKYLEKTNVQTSFEWSTGYNVY